MTASIQPFAIGEVSIRQHEGLFSLNDLHKAAGGEAKHQPALFLRLDQTQALANEISSSTDSQSLAVKTVLGKGKAQGTYACRELVIAYAAWISAAFHLKVIRVFLDAQAQPAPAPLAKLPDLGLTDGPAIPALPVRGTDAPLPRLDPAVWEHRSAGLTIEAAKNVVAALDQWAQRLPACGARNDVRDALEHLRRLLVRGWTEVDESLASLSDALCYLNRWQGRSGRFSSSR